MKCDNLEALRDALIVRKKATNVLKNLALQEQKRIEILSDEMVQKDDEDTKIKMRTERFNEWLIRKECDTVATCAADITGCLRSANTIYPDKTNPAFHDEVAERRVYMDKALCACNRLQDELQYIAESVYADKNKFTALVLEIDTLFRKIKALRQSDNRFWKKV